ncbi:hypothetical protein FRC01_012658 [Tulasnella sp. 417]|nr:hypothetical protein FRC01_012658 [Tulasnella sp. 417]
MLAQFRPAGKEMLPNLRKLTYNARQLPLPEALSSFLVFLSSSVVELELRQLTPGSMPSLLAYLVGRAPHVLDLKLAGSRSSEVDSNALATCLLRLEKLQFINTSIRLTPALWDAIAQHKGLTYASFASPTWGLPPTATGFQPREFARLERLVIRENFDFLCSLFESQNDLPKIIWVVFQGGCRGAGRNGFRRLCELLPQKFPNLEVVWLGCHSNAAQEDKALELGDFSPLMQRKNLRYFHLEHPCGVAVTESEFAQLLDAWPGITTLALQYASSNTDSRGIVYPINWTQPILPLSVLDIVAEKIPKVKELSLILDATAALGGAWKSDQHQFECLEKLTVSLSSISQPTPVASYLVQRSKKRFSLEYDPPLSLPGITLASLEEEKNKWDQVAQNLGLLYDQKERLEKEFRMQMQEERARHMRELKDVMDSSLALSRAE